MGCPVYTLPTYFGSLQTDIPQDFGISNNSVSEITVEIPAGAEFLFIAAPDIVYSDNDDPNGDFAVRIHYPQAPIRVTLLPPPPLHGTIYVIEPGPSMPVITAKADVIGMSPQQNGEIKFAWTVKLRARDGQGNEVVFDEVFKQNENTKGAKPYSVRLKKKETFRGGNLTLTAKATVKGQVLEGQTPAALTIEGRNPSRVEVQGYLDSILQKKFGNKYKGLSLSDIQHAMKRIACHESTDGGYLGQRQFRAPAGEVGPAIIAGDNGVGIFQITKTTKCAGGPFNSCPNAIFNWKFNVELAAENFKEKVATASSYPSNLVKHSSGQFGQYVNSVINPIRVTAELEPIPLSQNGGKFFVKINLPAYVTTGSFNDPGVNQILEDAVRGNNGFKGTLFGGVLHEFRPSDDALKVFTLNSLKTDSRVWRVVRPDERPPDPDPVRDYVNFVRRTSSLCQEP